MWHKDASGKNFEKLPFEAFHSQTVRRTPGVTCGPRRAGAFRPSLGGGGGRSCARQERCPPVRQVDAVVRRLFVCAPHRGGTSSDAHPRGIVLHPGNGLEEAPVLRATAVMWRHRDERLGPRGSKTAGSVVATVGDRAKAVMLKPRRDGPIDVARMQRRVNVRACVMAKQRPWWRKS